MQTKLDAKANKIILKSWLQNNIEYPYATASDLHQLSLRTGMERNKIMRWLQNQRSRSRIISNRSDIE